MAVQQKNSYVIGSNADLSNALLNIDLNRLGGDLTYLENDGGTLKVSVGSLIESEGSIYQVATAAETPTGTAQDGAYLFFDASIPGFAWSTTAGTYDPTRGGIYDASDRRQCRFRLSSATTFDVLVTPVTGSAVFDGDVTIDGSIDVPTGSATIGLNLTVDGDATVENQLIGLQGRTPTNSIHASGIPSNTVFDAIASSIPNTNDQIIVSGAIEAGGTVRIIARARRINSTTVRFYSVTDAGAINTIDAIDGDTLTSWDVSISW